MRLSAARLICEKPPYRTASLFYIVAQPNC